MTPEQHAHGIILAGAYICHGEEESFREEIVDAINQSVAAERQRIITILKTTDFERSVDRDHLLALVEGP